MPTLFFLVFRAPVPTFAVTYITSFCHAMQYYADVKPCAWLKANGGDMIKYQILPVLLQEDAMSYK